MLSLLVAAGCWAPVPDGQTLPPMDAGPMPDGGAWVCGPGTCAGCCDKNVCRPGTRESACGNHGMACAACADDALCGPMNSCEGLDPDRYGPGSPNGNQPSGGTGSTCRTINGAYVCW